MRRDRRMATDLERAIAADAQTFDRALTQPQVRDQLERALHKKLSDDTLRSMSKQAHAEAEYWTRYRIGLELIVGVEQPQLRGRRTPGQPAPVDAVPPIVNPENLPPPKPLDTGGYLPVPDRYRILDALGRQENPLDPYNTNTLKGDKPIFGDDWFLSLSGISDTRYEPARVPTGVGAQYTARPTTNSTFGRFGKLLFNQSAIVTVDLFQGDTAFKPPDIEFRFTPVFNYNHLDVGEIGLVNIDPRKGTTRDDAFLGIQEAFVDYHLRNVSQYFDFDSFRVGIQPFNADFRGFLFQDDQLGMRLFGNRDNNRWQYNLAFFQMLEKDTNSGLNSVEQQLRRNYVGVANVFRQDFPVEGFTSQLIYLRNDDGEANEQHYDKNGFLVRPAQIGDNRGYDYHVNYLGYNGDGHFGRINLTTSAYWENGSVSHNQLSLNPSNNGAHVNGFFVAAEPSLDIDFARLRLSGLYASGARNPTSGHLGGFDAVFENPQFAGADTSFFIRQSIPLIGGGGVALNTENGVLADLRSSKGEGESNFNNPGIALAGIGTDFDVLPELRISTNFNYLRFADTASLEALRHQANIPASIGYDLSTAFTYRPLFSQNIIFRVSGSVLLPGNGLKALFNTDGGAKLFGSGNFLYSVLGNVILTY
ncbi:MAG: hypothetical protein JO001_19945 [Alphaproteobacteria bacterium]|nr:hypothetical protein [Alphaproteobacteria bacterium]